MGGNCFEIFRSKNVFVLPFLSTDGLTHMELQIGNRFPLICWRHHSGDLWVPELLLSTCLLLELLLFRCWESWADLSPFSFSRRPPSPPAFCRFCLFSLYSLGDFFSVSSVLLVLNFFSRSSLVILISLKCHFGLHLWMQDLLSLRTIILRSGSFLVPTCSPKLHSHSPVLFVCFGLCLSFELVFSNVWFSWLSVYAEATKKMIGSLSLCDGEGFGAVIFLASL